mmetsp:Transcript_18276/g.15931  ORF Transcript_18276/g.15931 Transcript_18276/m.15931 type:complete len:138 (+) Transcript_18276:81-494(+)|eukprot:CAMPEP_0114579498 /NCGR_PEP_ID=MMETSP0125-20121206/3844_1 /TAXON_ID=485358 ORGANISM="Aristerostoma sp., Strain ATCC 50986" /NCGR_SAMPLE_ID=MMETSP0125 /ASSEMBLY_ACC=CAM_ASM_000245 /LENGTH=137 /DNA_ID=CAMNT_0001770241 /DNA_START=62 /DNA_END=475 /DNA_ORIENTATION=+
MIDGERYTSSSYEYEKKSLLSRGSDTISSLNESKGMIFENPDGTYTHAVLAEAKKKEEQKVAENTFNGYPRNRILYIVDDDEIALYSGFYELPTRVDDFLGLFMRHQRYFVVFLTFMMIIESLLCLVAYQNQDVAVD